MALPTSCISKVATVEAGRCAAIVLTRFVAGGRAGRLRRDLVEDDAVRLEQRAPADPRRDLVEQVLGHGRQARRQRRLGIDELLHLQVEEADPILGRVGERGLEVGGRGQPIGALGIDDLVDGVEVAADEHDVVDADRRRLVAGPVDREAHAPVGGGCRPCRR